MWGPTAKPRSRTRTLLDRTAGTRVPVLDSRPPAAFPHPQRLTTALARHEAAHAEYPARRYLQRSYLPHARGSVLVVGICSSTALEWELLADPAAYFSVDVDPDAYCFGRPGGHRTIDFFALDEERTYDHVILFGIFGEANGRGPGDAHVADEQVDAMIAKSLSLLNPGGHLVLGPELRGISWASSVREGRRWTRWMTSHPLIGVGFDARYAFVERCNWVAVLVKR